MTNTNTTKRTKNGGFVLYRGPSVLDPSTNIAVVATLKSKNRKTGDMIQVWILLEDDTPTDGRRTGSDSAICGSCIHRNGTCYVNLGHAPTAIHAALKRGSYPMATVDDIKKHMTGRAIRFGAYGDPAAAPFWIWKMLGEVGSMHTGYTHQANHPQFDERLTRYLMVSADSPKQAMKYQDKGWRTFRVKNADDGFLPREIECLADRDGLTCEECGACGGTNEFDRFANIAITVHGSGKTKFKTSNIIRSVNV